MYLITEEQLNALLDAVKRLPVKSEDFAAADLWVGIYMHLENIRNNPAPQEAPKNEGE